MGRPGRIAAAVAACGVATALASAAGLGAGWPGSVAARPAASGPASSALAGVAIQPGIRHVGNAQAIPPTTAECQKAYKVACFEPGQIQQAYNLPSLYASGVTGKGTTIVIVDPFGSPTIKHDLTVFDQGSHLPAPPSLQIIRPAGKVPVFNPGNSEMIGWAGETTLDVEYAHTIAPGARILLVETPVPETEGVHGFPQIVAAERYVITHHLGGVISQSFSATEQTFPDRAAVLALRGAYTLAAKDDVTVLAASGDTGAADFEANQRTYYPFPVTSWPDSDPLVTGVGGTQLHLSPRGTFTAPTVWNDSYDSAATEFSTGTGGPNPLASGGGKSVLFGRPSYQNAVAAVVGDHRGVPDVSMSAACNGAVITYSTYPGAPAGWSPSCGTSEATPLFAGIIALTGQMAGRSLGAINPALYQLSARHALGIVDVTHGNNTVPYAAGGRKRTIRGYGARRGYDLASGVGTVNAAAFVPELASLVNHSNAF